MGRTTSPRSRKSSQSSRISQSSAVQVGEKASGKNAIRTCFPRNCERVTRSPEVEGRVKSGATVPTAGGACGDCVSVDMDPPKEVKVCASRSNIAPPLEAQDRE